MELALIIVGVVLILAVCALIFFVYCATLVVEDALWELNFHTRELLCEARAANDQLDEIAKNLCWLDDQEGEEDF